MEIEGLKVEKKKRKKKKKKKKKKKDLKKGEDIQLEHSSGLTHLKNRKVE